MKATVIHNTNAGNAKGIDVGKVEAGLVGQGYAPVIYATDSEESLRSALKDVDGLVLVIGGDGSIRATALQLIGRPNVSLAFIPAGTANNIAATFGLQPGVDAFLDGLNDTLSVPFDIGRLRGPLGEHMFLEACGCGIYADALAEYDPSEGKSITRALQTLIELLPGYVPWDCELALDGKVFHEKLLLLEVLNTTMTGPHLRLAPDALPGDGLLDVIAVEASEQHSLLEYMRKLRSEELSELENVSIRRVKKIELVWTGFPVHVDGEVLVEIDAASPERKPRGVTPELKGERDSLLSIEVLPGALKLQLPRAVVHENPRLAHALGSKAEASR